MRNRLPMSVAVFSSETSNFTPSTSFREAVNGVPASPTSLVSIVQYSTFSKASISASRSQIILSATVWTRPAEVPYVMTFQSSGETR